VILMLVVLASRRGLGNGSVFNSLATSQLLTFFLLGLGKV